MITRPELHSYQKTGLKFLRHSHRAILGDDMGLGKTAQTLLAIEDGNFQRILIVCPNTLKEVWAREIRKWLGPDDTIIIVSGKEKDRANQIRQANANKGRTFLIIHYDVLRMHTTQLKVVDWCCIVPDEFHRLCNRNAKMRVAFKMVVVAAKRSALYGATGTPFMNRAEELWSLLNIIAPKDFPSYWAWINDNFIVTEVRYGTSSRSVKKVVGPKDPDALRIMLSKYILRRTKKDVLDLPLVTWVTIPVELDAYQRKTYLTMFSQYYADIVRAGSDEPFTTLANEKITQILRLKQICVSPFLIDKESVSVEGGKLDALIQIIEDSGDQKILVYSQFAECIKRLNTELNRRGHKFSMMIGDTPTQERMAAIDALKKEDTKGMLCTIQLGIGFTAVEASIIVLMDKHWNPKVTEQAIARLDRIGQLNPITVYDLETQKTIEKPINKVLGRKIALFDRVVPVAGVEISDEMEPQYDINTITAEILQEIDKSRTGIYEE